ncbi:hypothetical protein JMJ77_0013656 [Colletotrichum scovillei]|uniref:Secreted protein n=1 Tax=Colletotrichum scovillei TaxID=1209932 RepID=A0A9P7U7N3_9PEZI|nr:hypothetical protein JMJ78_0012946 [Colletotrichum scovillei]KAG7040659.1 hypothetical protein JMJ77_0013656 [Colletotrichum scovillei]KAG7060706.1 hypothetical protein JMJ76_0006249 [Colletotrichum scovillei]
MWKIMHNTFLLSAPSTATCATPLLLGMADTCLRCQSIRAASCSLAASCPRPAEEQILPFRDYGHCASQIVSSFLSFLAFGNFHNFS